MIEKRLRDLDFAGLRDRQFTASPRAWEDQVLYFLMLDRFSDGREMGYRDNDGQVVAGGATPPFQPADANSAIQTEEDARRWREAGVGWVGGTLKGLRTKLGYLQRLGVTAIWISPIFKQVAFQETYHGYGVQNLIDVDPHFGSREDLRELVDAAHAHGIYVILDIILNHTGNVVDYAPDRHRTRGEHGNEFLDPRWDGGPYQVAGYRDRQGAARIPFAPLDAEVEDLHWPDGAIWPAEFQEPATFTRQGHIVNWDYEPESLYGDFHDLKDVHLGQGEIDEYRPSAALLALCRVYQFWIAYADVDGFRVDTVKHMDLGATRFFTSVIHEFAQNLGKENFYLIGEITGGRARAFDTLERTGLDAALGISDEPDKLEYLAKGYRNPTEYFDLFRNSLLIQKESHAWFTNKVVTVLDDHDQVRKGNQKARFCGDDPASKKLLLPALALGVGTMGIPCIYYGTEQALDGAGGSDRYLREAMFGGEFGAFRSRNRHCFDEDGDVYRELAKILTIRRNRIALRRGRQYLCRISGDGQHFGVPHMIGGRMRSIVPWTRLFDDQEMLLAVSTDADESREAWVAVKRGILQFSTRLRCVYSSDEAQVGQVLPIEERATDAGTVQVVCLRVPAAGVVIYEGEAG
ncbi:MAG TPA: alpha-amylase family glycosyl hydrolase [Anaerolineae bacterium]|nr:alpha-amylase family glycosyl hydrolase [Anaerolineae bacterium]